MTPRMHAELHRHIRQRHPSLIEIPKHDIIKQQQQQSPPLTPIEENRIYECGKAALYGDGVKKDVQQGLSLLTPLALGTHFPSQFVLALYYRDTPDVCLDWCERACQHMEPRAWILYATILEQEGYQEDAIEWYCKAANKGIMAAASKAGTLLATSDPSRSRQYIEMAAHGGVASAQYTWGKIVDDAMESYEWIKNAAKQGHAEACYTLSDYISRGYGCLRNEKDAKRWFQRAIDNGYDIKCNLITSTRSGRNSPISNISTGTSSTPASTPPKKWRGKLTINTTPSFTSTSPTSSTDVSPSVEDMERHRNSLSTRHGDTIMTSSRDVEIVEESEDEDDDDVACPMFHDE